MKTSIIVSLVVVAAPTGPVVANVRRGSEPHNDSK
jgi:hypothetical protein